MQVNNGILKEWRLPVKVQEIRCYFITGAHTHTHTRHWRVAYRCSHFLSHWRIPLRIIRLNSAHRPPMTCRFGWRIPNGASIPWNERWAERLRWHLAIFAPPHPRAHHKVSRLPSQRRCFTREEQKIKNKIKSLFPPCLSERRCEFRTLFHSGSKSGAYFAWKTMCRESQYFTVN